MIAISSRSQYAPARSATYLAPSVKSTARLIAWRYQFSLPVNCAKSVVFSVLVITVSFVSSDPHGGGERRHGQTALERSCHSFLGATFRGDHKASLTASGSV